MKNNTYHHRNLKNELIKVGAKLLYEKGLEKFSLRQVAKEVGVSHTAPYRHFKTKEDLLAAIVLKGIDLFTEELVNAFDKYKDDPKEQVIQVGKAYVKIFTEKPDFMKVIFWGDLKTKIDITQILRGENNKKSYSVMEECAKNCIATGKTKVKDQNTLMLLLWSCVQGLSFLITEDMVETNSNLESLIDNTIRTHIEVLFSD